MAAGRTERKNPFLPIIFVHFLSFRFSRAKQTETQSSKSKRPLSFLSSIRRRKNKNKSIKLLEGVNSREKKRESPPSSSLSPSPSPPMENDLSAYQIQSMKEAFTLFDTDRDGKISPSDLGVLMRSLGSNPTQAQLRSIVFEEGLAEPFDFTRFVDLMSKYLRPEPFEQQLREAFKVIDKEGSGFVAVAELRHILTSIGEKLEPGEFDEWIREVDVGSDGRIKIEDFIARMVAK